MDFLLSKHPIFKNPKNLPLNELNLEIKRLKKIRKTTKDEDFEKIKENITKNYEVRVEKVPALNEYWIQKDRTYYLYQPYFIEVSVEENDPYFSKNLQFLETINFLLECSYHQFWCYMAFEPRVKKVLKSFIFNFTPWYEVKYLDERGFALYSEIHDKITQIFYRILTFSQSDVEFMSESSALKILENCQLLTFTVILRLCLLYTNSNQFLVNQWINLYVTSRSKYKEDFKKMFEQTMLIFEMIGGQICGFEDNTVIVPIGIGKKPKSFDPYWYSDVAIFLLDTVTNVNAFLSVCKLGIDIALELGLPFRLTFFYNKVFPTLYKVLDMKRNLPINWTDMKTRIYDYLAMARSECTNCFHIFVSQYIDNIVQELGNHIKQDEYLEQYIKLITTAMEDEYFIIDYHNSNEIHSQLQTITDFYPELDKMRRDYIVECLGTLPNLHELLAKQQTKNAQGEKNLPALENNVTITPAPPKRLTEAEIDERIIAVLETLPHLGDGYVLRCLEIYNYDPIEVISAILDNNLPPSLNDIPMHLIRVPPEPLPEPPIAAYRGKKPTYKDTKDLLDDKSDLQQVKNFVLKTSKVAYDMYDDEYDDREAAEPRITFRDEPKEEDPYKYMENRFEGYELVSDPSESSSDEEKQETSAFCKDPALLREQREAQRRARGKTRDLVGKPKGQGQDKQVLQNRDKKNTNKSSRANHNRKGGAQFKRNKGMIPS